MDFQNVFKSLRFYYFYFAILWFVLFNFAVIDRITRHQSGRRGRICIGPMAGQIGKLKMKQVYRVGLILADTVVIFALGLLASILELDGISRTTCFI
jgi:hypothetical protein